MVTSTEVNVAALLLLKGALSFATGVDVKKRDGVEEKRRNSHFRVTLQRRKLIHEQGLLEQNKKYKW